MQKSLLWKMGIDPAYILILAIILIIVLFVLLIIVNMKYNRLKSSYSSFMRGKDGKTMEEYVVDKFDEIEAISEMGIQNRQDIKDIYRKIESTYQKVGIVKYDAFHEMGGKLSFALTLLDGDDSGWLINAMHSREGCYTYIKEIVKGQSYIELAEEEAQSLEQAVYQEAYDLDVKPIKNKNKQ
ncbi:MAG: DUF4446 family protein [Lachnospiraceae bacterium]